MFQSNGQFAKDAKLHERLNAAMAYFEQHLHGLLDPVMACTKLQINNKQVATRYNNALEAFTLSYKVKIGVFNRLQMFKGFSVKEYLNAKALAALDEVKVSKEGMKIEKAVKKEKVPKEEKPKKVKVDTKAETLRLFRQGLTIKDIAVQRSLTEGTIERHLAFFVESGELDISTLVSTQHRKIIEGIVRSIDNGFTATDIKERLPDDYTYAEIRLVIADMRKRGVC